MLNQPKKKKKTWTKETSLVHEQAAGKTGKKKKENKKV